MKYKKKILITIILFVSVFCMNLKVEAGVCSYRESEFISSYCKAPEMNVTVSLDSGLLTPYGSDYLKPGYHASTVSGNTLAFCLDPGLSMPTGSLGHIREIDDNGTHKTYDAGVYAMYQLFYNNLIYSINNGGLTENFVNQQRSYLQFALRAWTYRSNYSQHSGGITFADNFEDCLPHVDSSFGSIDKSVSSCFGNDSNLESVKKYYQNAVNSTYLWKNPITITKDTKIITSSDNKTYYRYEFNINFVEGGNNFFEYLASSINYGDIQLSQAEFKLDAFSVNGEYCSSTNCHNYTASEVVSSGDSVQFYVELNQEQYDYFASKMEDKSVNVTMHYNYQHPLNIENLFISRQDFTNTYQRMLIIQNYVHYGDETIGSTKENELVSCKHESQSSFYNIKGDKISSIENFISSCGCSSINKDFLTTNEASYYDTKCTNRIISEEYDGGIYACDEDAEFDNVLDNKADTNYNDYNLKYIKMTSINNYCNEVCIETININNLKGKYTTKAGMYFEFDKYPSLVANKECYVDIDYTSWESEYKNNLQTLVDAYNDWKGREGANDSRVISPENDCDYQWVSCGDKLCYEPTKKLHKYYYVYYPLEVNGTTISRSSTPIYYDETICGLDYNWQVSEKKEYFQKLITQVNSITNLKSDLKTCNSYINNGSDNEFYDFQQKLNFYYSQTNSEGDIILNDRRIKNGNIYGIDDSEYNYDLTSKGNDNLSNTYVKNYDTFNVSTGDIITETIDTYSNSADNKDIWRNVSYNYIYTPKYTKGVEFYTGVIEDITDKTNISKYIKLGNGYDTDITAIQKNNNDFYYIFSQLGDKDNKIFNRFKTGETIERSCTYEITNEVVTGCEDGDCSDDDVIDPSINLVYRIVDPINIDPNNRFGSEGFKNWNTDKGKAVMAKIESDATSNKTYTSENLEYSFTLDSAKIQEIRNEVNKGNNYSDFKNYECNNDGNECKSSFVTEYANKNDSNILIGNGRSLWKKFTKEDNKCSIDGKEVACS